MKKLIIFLFYIFVNIVTYSKLLITYAPDSPILYKKDGNYEINFGTLSPDDMRSWWSDYDIKSMVYKFSLSTTSADEYIELFQKNDRLIRYRDMTGDNKLNNFLGQKDFMEMEISSSYTLNGNVISGTGIAEDYGERMINNSSENRCLISNKLMTNVDERVAIIANSSFLAKYKDKIVNLDKVKIYDSIEIELLVELYPIEGWPSNDFELWISFGNEKGNLQGNPIGSFLFYPDSCSID